jgi:small subunit ribosomal protein S6
VVEDEIDKINTQIESIVTTGGGTVAKVEKMGKRRLAYPVDKFRDGFYVLLTILATGDIIKETERRLRVLDPVIKYLTVRKDEDIRRQAKIKVHRAKRALRRSTNAGAAGRPAPEQSIEE